MIDNDGNFVDEDGNIIKPIGQIDIVNDVVNTTLTEEITNTTTEPTNTTNTVVNNVVDNQDDVIEVHNEPIGQIDNNEPVNTGTTEENPQMDVPREEQSSNNNNLNPVKGQDKTILVPKNTDTSKVIDVPVGTSESSIPKSGSPRKVGIIGLIVLLVGISLYFYKKNDEYKY